MHDGTPGARRNIGGFYPLSGPNLHIAYVPPAGGFHHPAALATSTLSRSGAALPPHVARPVPQRAAAPQPPRLNATQERQRKANAAAKKKRWMAQERNRNRAILSALPNEVLADVAKRPHEDPTIRAAARDIARSRDPENVVAAEWAEMSPAERSTRWRSFDTFKRARMAELSGRVRVMDGKCTTIVRPARR
jgi:type IV secretory pathway VirB10-like protein